MNRQSTIIFATLIVAFIIFITVRGDLPAWLALFTQKGKAVNTTVSNGAASPSSSPSSSGGGGILGAIGKVLKGGIATLIPGGVGDAIQTSETFVETAMI